MYSLSDVKAALLEAPWMTRAVALQPLEGLADGVNKVFRFPFAPLAMTPAPFIYTLVAGGKVAVTVDVINYDTGDVLLSTAPTLTPYADFMATMFRPTQLDALARRGFIEMQIRWLRSLYLYNDDGTIVVSASDSEAVDPVTGATTFSKSEVQKGFLVKCAEFVALRMLVEDANINSMSYREERMGGLLVDLTRRAKDFQEYLKAAAEALRAAEDAARSECGEFTEFGAFIPGPQLINGEWTHASL